jgi:hypothetical protein
MHGPRNKIGCIDVSIVSKKYGTTIKIIIVLHIKQCPVAS